MSYPYPFEDKEGLWGSFSLFEPAIGQIIEAPDGKYKVCIVKKGTHSSAGLYGEHPGLFDELGGLAEGWFWYGIRLPKRPEITLKEAAVLANKTWDERGRPADRRRMDNFWWNDMDKAIENLRHAAEELEG